MDYYDLEFGSSDVNTPGFTVDVPKWSRFKTAAFGEFRNISDAFVRLRTDAFYQKSKKDMVNSVPGSMGSMSYVVQPMAYNTTDQYGFSLQTDWQLGERNYLIAGYELSYDDLSAQSITQMTMPMMTMVMGNKLYDGYQMTNAVYASMETQLPADVTLTYGARYTWVKTDMDSRDVKKAGDWKNANQSDGKLIFNAGLLWLSLIHI